MIRVTRVAAAGASWVAAWLVARRLSGAPGIVPRLFAPASLDAPAPGFVAVNRAFRSEFRARCFWCVLADVLSLDWSLSRLRRINNHDERLNLFETALPDESLRWIAAHVNVAAWAAQYDGAALRRDLCPPPRATTVERFVLLAKGQPAWTARLDLIRGARRKLLVQYAYIYLDNYGWAFCTELAAAADRGVDVEVMIDEFGAESFNFGEESPHHPCRPDGQRSTWDDMMRLLLDAGVSVTYWRGLSTVEGKEFATKNHTKTLIADDRVAILGDRNIGSEYFDTWAGADILVVGDAARALSRSFVDDMAPYLVPCPTPPTTTTSVSGRTAVPPAPAGQLEASLAAYDALYPLAGSESESGSTMAAEVLVHLPSTHGYDPILHRIIAAVRSATTSVDIRSCYMLLARALQDELVAASQRGVAVRFVTNSARTNDLLFIHTAMCESLIAPVEAGAVALFATKAMDHTKFIVVDKRWICVGSWNCWLRTHFYEAETNVVVDDAAMGERLVREEIDDVTRDELIESGEIAVYTAQMLKHEADAVSARLGHRGDAFSAMFI